MVSSVPAQHHQWYAIIQGGMIGSTLSVEVGKGVLSQYWYWTMGCSSVIVNIKVKKKNGEKPCLFTKTIKYFLILTKLIDDNEYINLKLKPSSM